MKTIHVDVVSGEEHIFDAEAMMVVLPGLMGELGIMPGHTALLTRLTAGEMRLILQDDSEKLYYVSGGYAEIQPYQVSVLADTVMRASSIDEQRAQIAREKADQILKQGVIGIDYAQAKAELAAARTIESH
ncbi:MAG TPA: F0F1 ATP synthase subunit epsilon [Chromatiales bacterium]|nr:F0F1 ATP synthase subunit epsilon [Thiotrichales bacterium]HIP69158.1 F0F1 ATP synthase subunit epsilon [Chromatiales bacterium]